MVTPYGTALPGGPGNHADNDDVELPESFAIWNARSRLSKLYVTVKAGGEIALPSCTQTTIGGYCAGGPDTSIGALQGKIWMGWDTL